MVPRSAPCVTKAALANPVVWAAYLAREASTLRPAARANAASAALASSQILLRVAAQGALRVHLVDTPTVKVCCIASCAALGDSVSVVLQGWDSDSRKRKIALAGAPPAHSQGQAQVVAKHVRRDGTSPHVARQVAYLALLAALLQHARCCATSTRCWLQFLTARRAHRVSGVVFPAGL